MKKFLVTVFALLFSFNANAFIISPHVGIDYVSSTPNGYGNIDSLNGATISAGVKALGFLSVEGYYQKYFSTDASNVSATKSIPYAAGLVLNKKVGDKVNNGDLLITVYTNKENVNDILKEIEDSFEISIDYINKTNIIKGYIE